MEYDQQKECGQIEKQFTKTLGLQRRPIAVAFRESAPAGVDKFTGTEPSGCSFWRLAASGRTFYTVPADHYNCAVGSHTHNIALPPERAAELEQTLSFMTGIGYIKMEEVGGIPRLPEPPGVVIYAPLAESPAAPDVVLFAGTPRQLMLLQEAAQRAGKAAQLPLLGRPTCMALPAAMAHGAVMSTGCIGNRVYTDLEDGGMYLAVPGNALAAIAAELGTIAAANAKLMEYHRDRRQTVATE
jgi:uncharacterized protein (DUF169 family)